MGVYLPSCRDGSYIYLVKEKQDYGKKSNHLAGIGLQCLQ